MLFSCTGVSSVVQKLRSELSFTLSKYMEANRKMPLLPLPWLELFNV